MTTQSPITAREAANIYAAAGLCALPAIKAQKRPAVTRWREYQAARPTSQQVATMFDTAPEADAVCLVCGAVSGHLEILDFDNRGELYDAWAAKIDPEALAALAIERSPSGGYHVAYRSAEPVEGNQKLAQRATVTEDGRPSARTLIETRGEGGLFLCWPSPGYEMVQGDLADVPTFPAEDREILLAAARELNEYTPAKSTRPAAAAIIGVPPGDRPGDDFNKSARGLEEARAALERAGWSYFRTVGGNEHWTRPGKSTGTSATFHRLDGVFYCHTSSGHPFDPGQAYSPYAVYAMLAHHGDYSAASSALRAQGFGVEMQPDPLVDLSRFNGTAKPAPAASQAGPVIVLQDPLAIEEGADPEPVPDRLLDAPGFIREVMDLTLSGAYRPNRCLAFCGALALQAFLAGRKIKHKGSRTNPYIIALAPSGTGKEYPRQVNTEILRRVGLLHCVGDRFASGEGLEDALAGTPAMLFQTDEIDHLLRAVSKDRDGSKEAISALLLQLFTRANSAHPMRRKAGQSMAGMIHQPCLVMFGTATPQNFYSAISGKMQGDGLLARMMILEAGRRSAGQDGRDLEDIPEGIIETAKYWANVAPGSGNLANINPTPANVPVQPEATACLQAIQEEADALYEGSKSEMGRAYWSRAQQHAEMLALIRAASENHRSPIITAEAMQWAGELTFASIRRTLFAVESYSAESQFDADRLRFLRLVRENGGALPRSAALRRMKMPARQLNELLATVIESGELAVEALPTAGRTSTIYRLNRAA